MSQSLRDALADARAALDRAKSSAGVNTRLTAEGKRIEVTRATTSAISRAVKELRATTQHVNTLQSQYEAAQSFARRTLPEPSDIVKAEVWRTARENEAFRADLSTLCMTGAFGEGANATLLLAVIQAPHPAVAGLTANDVGAAKASLENYLDENPTIAGIREQLDDARFAVTAAKRALKEFESDLDLDELRKARALPPSPYDLPAEESQEWLAKDPGGWALAAANAGSFNWEDTRPVVAA